MTYWEQHCQENAQYFTAVRGHRPLVRIREEFKTLDEAIQYAKTYGDNRTMIYAVTDTGSSAHIQNA